MDKEGLMTLLLRLTHLYMCNDEILAYVVRCNRHICSSLLRGISCPPAVLLAVHEHRHMHLKYS